MKVPAKINIYLHIAGKRPDGYHLLDSMIVFTDIFDEVKVKKADRFSLEISGEFASLVENNENNIICRAVNLMAKECFRSGDVAIELIKNIPVGAGLGGGSADAAATIILLNELWQTNLPEKKLIELGLKLGADVPVFIGRQAAFISGIGEGLMQIENLPELYAILIYPNRPLSTKHVFDCNAKLNNQYAGQNIKPSAIEEEMLSFIKNQKNDLQNAAISLLPEIKEIIDALSVLQGCLFARMSGSGSTCFAIFTDKETAERNVMKLNREYMHYWVKFCKLKQSF